MQVLDLMSPPEPFLSGYHRACTVQEALEYLHARHSAGAILSCYAHYFPQQWAVSTAAWTPAHDSAYSPREWEFFDLIDRHLFPLNLDWLQMQDDDGPAARELELPIARGGLDWWECYAGDLRPGWELLLRLLDEWPSAADEADDDALDDATDDDTDDNPDAAGADHAQGDDGAPPAHPPPAANTALAQRVHHLAGRPYEPPRLHQLTAAAGPPLSGLPAALAMIRHDTGSAWLDAGPEHEMDLCWTIPDVAHMIADYQIGRPLAQQAAALIDWLDQPAHVAQLLDLWAACLTEPPPTPPRAT